MNVEISSRVLPGIGVCQELELHDEHRVGIVTRRNGLRDFVIYDEEGDGAKETLALTDDEANALAEILGAPQLTFRLAVLQRQADGLMVEQLPVPANSPYAGRSLGDTQARSRTGASIVAVLRRGAAIPSPTPDFVLLAEDLVVAVGTQAAVDLVSRILDGTAGDASSAPTPSAAPPTPTTG